MDTNGVKGEFNQSAIPLFTLSKCHFTSLKVPKEQGVWPSQTRLDDGSVYEIIRDDFEKVSYQIGKTIDMNIKGESQLGRYCQQDGCNKQS